MNTQPIEAEPETEIAAMRRELATWKARALGAEAALQSRPGRVVVIRGDWGPFIGRVHDYVRLEDTLTGAAAFIDPDALRLACRVVGLAVRQ